MVNRIKSDMMVVIAFRLIILQNSNKNTRTITRYSVNPNTTQINTRNTGVDFHEFNHIIMQLTQSKLLLQLTDQFQFYRRNNDAHITDWNGYSKRNIFERLWLQYAAINR